MAAGFKSATVNAADVPATQTDFTAYVDLSRTGITTLAEAQSVRVYADSGKVTEWAREIVSVSEMWVKVPSLTSTVSIYVDWDGVRADYAATDTYGRNAVWTGNTVVYHMGDATTSTVADSTSNGYTGTKKAAGTPAEATGKIGNAQDGTYTLENSGTWINNASVNPNVYITMGTNTGDNGKLAVYVSASFQVSTNTFSAGTWYKVRANFTGSQLLTYVNGTLWDTFSKTTTARSFTFWFNADAISDDRAFVGVDGSTMSIMSRTNGAGLWPLDGKMDEFHWTASSVSANWETTEYNNQDDEAGFWGTWSTVGGGAAVSPTLTMRGVGA